MKLTAKKTRIALLPTWMHGSGVPNKMVNWLGMGNLGTGGTVTERQNKARPHNWNPFEQPQVQKYLLRFGLTESDLNHVSQNYMKQKRKDLDKRNKLIQEQGFEALDTSNPLTRNVYKNSPKSPKKQAPQNNAPQKQAPEQPTVQAPKKSDPKVVRSPKNQYGLNRQQRQKIVNTFGDHAAALLNKYPPQEVLSWAREA